MFRGGDQPRTFAHMDLDTFFVSVELLKNASLIGKPLMIGGQGGRGVVASCSYEARQFGIRSGMAMGIAKRLCPSAKVISGDYEAYARYSRLVADIVVGRSPLCEQSSIDEFYIDLTGMGQFWGEYKWTAELAELVTKETGLPISFGVASAKYLAKMATNQAKPRGRLLVAPGSEQRFLDPLPVRKIPFVGETLTEKLAQLGIADIAALRQVPLKVLQRMFGKMGTTLWQRARGIDNSLVVPYREEKSISTECTFQEDSTDTVALKATLQKMAEGLSHTLRKSGKLTACITVKIRYADFNTYTKQAAIPFTSKTNSLARKAQELFDRLFDRRQRIRLIGVCFSNLAYGGDQADLFDDTEERLQLDKAVDRIKNRFGPHAVMSASALGSLTRREGQRESYGNETEQPYRKPLQQDSTAREFPEWVPDAIYCEMPADGF